MVKKRKKREISAQAQRLRNMRKRLGYPVQKTFAQILGIEPRRWNNFENSHPLSKEIARRLLEKFPGLDLDYLDRGNTDGLSIAMARRLGEMDAEK